MQYVKICFIIYNLREIHFKIHNLKSILLYLIKFRIGINNYHNLQHQTIYLLPI